MKRLLILLIVFCGFFPALALGDSHDPERIMPAEVMMKMNAGEEVLFLDTRNSRDWANAKMMIPDAIRISSSEVLTKVAKETPKEKLIVTYCTWPNEYSSASLARHLIDAGFTNAYPLEGGLTAWMDAGYPAVPVKK